MCKHILNATVSDDGLMDEWDEMNESSVRDKSGWGLGLGWRW